MEMNLDIWEKYLNETDINCNAESDDLADSTLAEEIPRHFGHNTCGKNSNSFFLQIFIYDKLKSTEWNNPNKTATVEERLERKQNLTSLSSKPHQYTNQKYQKWGVIQVRDPPQIFRSELG